jgi:hypothetical protein
VRVYYRCPQCDSPADAELSATTTQLPCPACNANLTPLPNSLREGHLHSCVVCSNEVYIRKDFPQRLGIAIVVIAVILSSITWYYRWVYATYGIFFGSAALDFLLMFVCGDLLQCYRCQAQYREVVDIESYERFNLETHEKQRQQEIRLREAEAAQRREQTEATL